MKRRIPDLVLIALLLIGGVWAWSTGRERARLQAEYDHLVLKVGDLPIGDPSRLHIRAIPTGEPLHLAWRVFVPANYPVIRRSSLGSSGSSTNSSPNEFICRVRLREEQGYLNVFDQFCGGSSRSGIGPPSMTDLLRGKWDKVVVEQLGSQKVEAIETGGSTTLLRLSLPEDLQAEARKTLTPFENQRFNPVLFSLELGPEKPSTTAPVPGK